MLKCQVVGNAGSDPEITIIGSLAAEPELLISPAGTACMTALVVIEPAYPSALWPSPEETILVIATGLGVERLAESLRAGDRVRVCGHSQTGVVLIATAIRSLDPLPDSPAVPTNPSLLLCVTMPGALSPN